jgi:hypothetical protein
MYLASTENRAKVWNLRMTCEEVDGCITDFLVGTQITRVSGQIVRYKDVVVHDSYT